MSSNGSRVPCGVRPLGRKTIGIGEVDMGKYVVMAFATLHKDIIVEAESEDLAQAKVECAFADGRLEFSMDDFVADFNDYEVMTPDVALQLDGVAESDCVALK